MKYLLVLTILTTIAFYRHKRYQAQIEALEAIKKELAIIEKCLNTIEKSIDSNPKDNYSICEIHPNFTNCPCDTVKKSL